jgi:type I restriction enzyme M protein
VAVEKDLKPQAGSRRKIGPTDYHAAGVVYLPDEARFSYLLSLSESGSVGQAVNEAMRAIEKENPDLADVLPKSYHILESRTLASLLKTMASISMDKGGESEPDGRDIFGLIYEYFLGKFAMSEGQKGGEFFSLPSTSGRGAGGGLESGLVSGQEAAFRAPFGVCQFAGRRVSGFRGEQCREGGRGG